MARTSVLQKLENYILKLNILPESKNLLNYIIENSKNNILNDFSAFCEQYTQTNFEGSIETFNGALKPLIESVILKVDGYEDRAVVLGMQPHHINNLLFGLVKKGKRKILKSNNKGFKTLGDNISPFAPAENKAEVKGTTGFKVYQSFMPWLTGKPMDEEEGAKYISRPEQYAEMQAQRNINREDIRLLCAFFTYMQESTCTIYDFVAHNLYQNIIKDFGADSFCITTFYNSLQNLYQKKILLKVWDAERRSYSLKAAESTEIKRERFIIVPFCVLKDADFKKLELASIRSFFEILNGLNNGEIVSKGGYVEKLGQAKTFYIKVDKLPNEKIDSIEEFNKKINLQYKKRNAFEIRKMLFGDAAIKDKEVKNKGLSKYFNFYYLPTPESESGLAEKVTVVQCRVRPEYYISKEKEIEKRTLNILGRNKIKATLVEEELKSRNINFKNNDLVDLVCIFRDKSANVIKSVLDLITRRISENTDPKWKIEKLGAYARAVLKSIIEPPPEPDGKATCEKWGIVIPK
jgi:hypothetical protein